MADIYCNRTIAYTAIAWIRRKNSCGSTHTQTSSSDLQRYFPLYITTDDDFKTGMIQKIVNDVYKLP